jgi:thymidylate synthase (FAD)
MKATLLASTPNATKRVATAAWICTHQDFPTEADLHPDKCGPLVQRVIGYGHESILEHASFTFAIQGISRACSHQLVRYRIAAFSQQSQRYVKFKDFPEETGISEFEGFAYPPTILANRTLIAKYNNALRYCACIYEDLMRQGVPPEDARFVLPNAATTKLVMTMNARELRHFFSQRLCKRAQWEIRELATEIYLQCKAKEPVLFVGCGPDCKNCEEKEPCK